VQAIVSNGAEPFIPFKSHAKGTAHGSAL